LFEHLNETSYEVWKCMDQQRSALVKHIIKYFSCLPLSLTYVLSLNHLITDHPSQWFLNVLVPQPLWEAHYF